MYRWFGWRARILKTVLFETIVWKLSTDRSQISYTYSTLQCNSLPQNTHFIARVLPTWKSTMWGKSFLQTSFDTPCMFTKLTAISCSGTKLSCAKAGPWSEWCLLGSDRVRFIISQSSHWNNNCHKSIEIKNEQDKSWTPWRVHYKANG